MPLIGPFDTEEDALADCEGGGGGDCDGAQYHTPTATLSQADVDYWYDASSSSELYGPSFTLGDWTFIDGATFAYYSYPASWDGQGCVTFTILFGEGAPTIEVCCGPP